MKRLDIKIGFKCNNVCRHCVQGKKRERYGNKPLAALKEEIQAASVSCKAIVFTGGEPTIHSNFLKLVNYAREIGYKKIQIQSNGRMFSYRSFMKECISAGATEFAAT